MALEVLKKIGEKLDAVKADLEAATEKVAAFSGTEPSERAKLELARDEQLRRTQEEDKRYQIAKDLSDNFLQHVRGHYGAANANDVSQGARLFAGCLLLFDQ